MNDIDVFEADLNGQDLQIAIVQARFNLEHIVRPYQSPVFKNCLP